MATDVARPSAEDVEPVSNETVARVSTGLVTVLPVLALGLVAWQLWGSALGYNDLFVFAIMYVATGLGITVGFHRLFTHRSFKTGPGVRRLFAILGSMAVEGPVIAWVADHRKHHAFSDQPGDPHSPHVDHGQGLRGALKGLGHAHVGWLFIHTDRGRKTRYAPDLIADPVVKLVNDQFVLWVAAGLVIPFCLGFVFGGGSLFAGFTGMLWGGFVRMLVLHHVTYSINSLCHFFGRKPLRDRRRVAQPGVAGAAVLRRGLAQRAPRVPDVGAPRARPPAVRPVGDRHRRAREDRPRVGRRACVAGADRGEEGDGLGLALAKPDALRAEIERALPDRPFAIQWWDGSRTAATRDGGPTFAVRSPRAVGHALRAPGQLGIGRAYVSGELEVDDIDARHRAAARLGPARHRRARRGAGWRSRRCGPTA